MSSSTEPTLRSPFRLRLPRMRREVVTLTLLTALGILLFIGVTALSQLFHAQQAALAVRWSARGDSDLSSSRFNAAVNDYRASLRYGEGSYSSQLGLAEALIGQKQTSEASAYLTTLWEKQPEDGVVNRELARIAASQGETHDALRYYHNAIYAIWTNDPEQERRRTRWELIQYLLSIKALTQAQSELIALAAEVGDDPGQHVELGQYFLKTQDEQHALASFRQALKVDPHNQHALSGAGEAAFAEGDYTLAQHFLHQAVEEDHADQNASALLEISEQVMQLDPYRRRITDAERDAAASRIFAIAGARLSSCPAASADALSTGSTQTLGEAWTKMKPHITERNLQRNPDTVTEALNLAFAIEREAGTRCGSAASADTALLLISKSHEGS